MANTCYNEIEINGSEKEIKAFKKIFKSKKAIKLEDNYLFLKQTFGKSENDASWFDMEMELENECTIRIYGDSAWVPALNLFTKISKEYQSFEIEYSYNEMGCDFSGIATMKKGILEDSCYPYWEGEVVKNVEYAFDCAKDELKHYETMEEFLSSAMLLAFKADKKIELITLYEALEVESI